MIFELSFEVLMFVLIKHHDIRIPRMLRAIYATCLHNYDDSLANMAHLRVSVDEVILEGLEVSSWNHFSMSTTIITVTVV